MEAVFFLVSSPTCTKLSIGSWNIHGINNKLDNNLTMKWLLNYDLVFLNEIKTSLSFAVPGYKVFVSDNSNPHRGGTALLIRNNLADSITWMDNATDGQIWLKLSMLPEILIGGCYVPPSDSPYYDISMLANIEAQIMSNINSEFILIGDLNARCGKEVGLLLHTETEKVSCRYMQSCDDARVANQNGQHIIQLCKDSHALIVNNLQYGKQMFQGGLTFRRKNQWISEVDLCVLSHELIHSLSKFEINQDLSLPSDHAPIGIAIDVLSLSHMKLDNILLRSSSLGDHAVLHSKNNEPRLVKRPIRYDEIDQDLFSENIQVRDPPVVQDDFQNTVEEIANTLYQCSRDSKVQPRVIHHNETQTRWQRIVDSQSEKVLWRAINWKGEMTMKSPDAPSDEQFKRHLEKLCNPEQLGEVDFSGIRTGVTIPVLDRPIDPNEVEDVLRNHVKPNKGCGPDGVAPGVLTLLPVTWIISITAIFNVIFTHGFPHSWLYAKLMMLFKKGHHELCGNYRGISLINSLAKAYDYVLYKRLTLWFTPSREQAGAQQGRGCIEHIVSLRLIMDYCVSKKHKLYVVYIDFSKAYDRIPRDRLMRTLKRLGCGLVMLSALMSMYKVSYSILGTAVIAAVIGVRQGSPTSCFLFTCYVDDLITLVKERCGFDGYLKWLHVLMLMDDTVVLATSREECIKKLQAICEFCDNSGMVLNQEKTKFMVINSSVLDKRPLEIPFGDITYTIYHCESYVYLGSIFTSDGKIQSAITNSAMNAKRHLMKFVAFLSKNPDFPFFVKHKVMNSAFLAAILYGCEGWLINNCSAMNKVYISCIKALLGVRQTTPNDPCLLELGYPPLKKWIKNRQYKFFKCTMDNRSTVERDPLMFAIDLATSAKTPAGKYLIELLEGEDYFQQGLNTLRNSVATSTKSKLLAYCAMNPQLSIHPIYKRSNNLIPEHQRQAFTRLRLVSHKLRIETGRWARIPREQRLCSCGDIQTEEHVICHCRISQNIRELNPHMTFEFPDFFCNTNKDICRVIHEILLLYQ